MGGWSSRVLGVVLLLMLVHGAGCSLTFTTGVPTPSRGPAAAGTPQACTSSRTLPFTDLAVSLGLTAPGVVLAVLAQRSSDCQPGRCGDTGPGLAVAAGIAALVPAAVYAISAVYGFHKTAECRAYEAAAAKSAAPKAR